MNEKTPYTTMEELIHYLLKQITTGLNFDKELE